MTERTDRELLELAAKAAGIRLEWDGPMELWQPLYYDGKFYQAWDPLLDDGDALRLAANLNMDIRYESCADGVSVTVAGAWDGAPEPVHEIFESNATRAVRRAIVRAAAAMAEGGE